MNLGYHRVFQQPTQIAQITLMAQMRSDGGIESICVICEISEISVRFWISRDAWPSSQRVAIPRLAALARNDKSFGLRSE
jgi:hypothetical protein